MNISDDPTYNDFINRGIKKTTQTRDLYALRLYTDYTGLTPTELLEEAEEDEDERIRMRKRRIRTHLQGFQEHLKQKEYNKSGATRTIRTIRRFYSYFEIELPSLPNIFEEGKKETIDDIPDMSMIRRVIEHCNPKYKAIILLMATSGIDTGTLKKLTLEDWLKSTSTYRGNRPFTTVSEDIKHLRKEDTIIPCWNVTRSKTGVSYFTFNTPETSEAILDYLEYYKIHQSPMPADPDDLLFPGSKAIPLYFAKLNDTLGLGWKKEHRRVFHAHSLRKFFATTLEKHNMPHLATRFLMGHTIDSVTGAYFKPDQESLKREYMRMIPYLSMEKVEVRTLDGDAHKELVRKYSKLMTKSELQSKQLDLLREELLYRIEELEKKDE